MTNTSLTPGWLTPINAGPDYDDELAASLCAWVAGVSGLPPEEVHKTSEKIGQTSGASLEIVAIERDVNSAMQYQLDDSAMMDRGETLRCQLRFYGPQAQAFGCRFLDGIELHQNQSEFQRLGFCYTSQEPLTAINQLINTQPVKYYQVMLHLSRTVNREYGVMTLKQAPFFLTGE